MDIEEAARRITAAAEELAFAMSSFDDDEAPEAFAYADRDDLRTTPGCNFGHGSRTFTPDGERFGADASFIIWRFVSGYAEALPWVERGWRTRATVTPPAAS